MNQRKLFKNQGKILEHIKKNLLDDLVKEMKARPRYHLYCCGNITETSIEWMDCYEKRCEIQVRIKTSKGHERVYITFGRVSNDLTEIDLEPLQGPIA